MSATETDVRFLFDIPIELIVELGRTNMTVRELSELRKDDVVQLEREAGHPLDIMAGGQLFGRGEVVVLEDRVGLRIVELVGKPDVEEAEEA